MFKIVLTRTSVLYKMKLERNKEEKNMKKNIKIIALIYIGVAVFTYAISLRMNRLEMQEDVQKQNQEIVIRIK